MPPYRKSTISVTTKRRLLRLNMPLKNKNDAVPINQPAGTDMIGIWRKRPNPETRYQIYPEKYFTCDAVVKIKECDA